MCFLFFSLPESGIENRFDEFDRTLHCLICVSKQVKLVKGTCAAGAALSTCQSSLFTSSGAAAATGEGAGVGANVGARLLVVMMAGKSSDSVSSVSASIKQSGVKILCVGMGGDFDTDQMTAIASSSSYFLSVSSFSALSGMSSQFISLISQGKSVCVIWASSRLIIYVSGFFCTREDVLLFECS